jgi:dTMP kinase
VRATWTLDATILSEAALPKPPTIHFWEPSYPGRLIVFEGIDGSGKSTSLAAAAEYLGSRGLPVETLDILYPESRRLPYFRTYADDSTTAIRGEVDQPSLGVVCMGDRLARFRTELYPKLLAGAWILCDRYVLTPIAESMALGVDSADLDMLTYLAGRFPRPDAGFAPHVPVEWTLKRIRERPQDQDKNLDPGFYRRAVGTFRDLLAHHDFVELDTQVGHAAVKNRMSAVLDELIAPRKEGFPRAR